MEQVERVGVIPRSLADDLGLLGHGFRPLEPTHDIQAIEDAIVFIDRPLAEIDPSQKQIIPYAVVCRGSEVFTVERLTGGGEARLHGKVSIGIGGHINPPDGDGVDSLIRVTFQRELTEELRMSPIESARVCGFINDDSQPVGQVHLGVVFRVDLALDGEASVREEDALQGGFMRWRRLEPLRPRMETWSAFVLDAHENGQLAPVSAESS
jgi:predicted NUDIX family phosphoesterase